MVVTKYLHDVQFDATWQSSSTDHVQHLAASAVMDWIPSLASTAVGALIALVATMISERSKWKREQLSTRRTLRQQTYATYMTALTDAHEQMRAQAQARHRTSHARYTAVHDAFRQSRCYHLRYEVAITAEQNVLDSAEDAFQIMRSLRDLLAHDGNIDSDEYKALRTS